MDSERLPIELIIDVLEYAQTINGLTGIRSPAWLANYSLVSRKWRPYAQKLLFRSVRLPNAKKCTKFMQAVMSSDQTENLWSYIEALHLTMDHQDVYADLICACPSLRELELHILHASFRPVVIEKLREAPAFTSLRVRSLHFVPFYQLHTLFPSVKYLHADLKSLRNAAPWLPSTVHVWTLVELRLGCVQRDVHNLLAWLLPPASESRKSIRILHLDDPPRSNILRPLIIDTGPRLLSLRLNYLRSEDVSCIEGCSELQELIIAGIPPFRALFDVLPSSLEHLALPALGYVADEILDGLRAHHTKATDVNGYPFQSRLRTITYELATPRSPAVAAEQDDVHGLRVFCALARPEIEFRYFDPLYGTQRGESEPIGPPSGQGWEFPRERVLSERRTAAVLPPLVLNPEPAAKRSVLASFGRKMSGLKNTMSRRGGGSET